MKFDKVACNNFQKSLKETMELFLPEKLALVNDNYSFDEGNLVKIN